MDKNYRKGQKLFVELTDGTVEGVFHSMDPDHNRLTLKKVILHPSGKQMDGIYHYYRNEVLNICVLELASSEEVNEIKEATGKWNCKRTDLSVPEVKEAAGKWNCKRTDLSVPEAKEAAGKWNCKRTDLSVPEVKEAAGKWDCNRKDLSVPDSKPSGKINVKDVGIMGVPGFRPALPNSTRGLTDEEYDRLSSLIQNHVMIEKMGEIFVNSLTDIKAETIIGVHVQGAFLGRSGKVTLVNIATPTKAFIFDVQTLGQVSFDKGLRDILESKNIQKIVHNCRLVSDCLFHRHRVTLTNVFDTQAGDLMITRNKYGQYPSRVRSLPQCLSKYLHLPDNLLYSSQGYKTDLKKWSQRPLPVELEGAAVKSCIFLIHLREKILEEYMSPLENCIDVFLNAVRDADKMEGSEHQATDKLVPLQLLLANKFSKTKADE